MYKRDHPKSHLAEQAVQRRRRLDDERKLRIFDPKTRTIGIDVDGLAEQIRIKRELEDVERQRCDLLDKTAALNNATLQLLDTHAEATRRGRDRLVETFRAEQQKMHTQRDFDLYDPDRLRKDLPGRVGDYDHRNSVSGLQKFEGEDLASDERTRLQKRQILAWTNSVMRERSDARRQSTHANMAADAECLRNHDRVLLLEAAERQRRREQALADCEFNKSLALEKKRRVEDLQKLEEMQNDAEISGMCNSDLLTERRAPLQSSPHSLRIDAFKCMTENQIQEILDTRAQQIEDANRRRSIEEKNEQDWDNYRFNVARTATLLEREQNRIDRAKNLDLLDTNKVIAEECKKRAEYIEKVVYTNPPTNDFFNQFNTTSR